MNESGGLWRLRLLALSIAIVLWFLSSYNVRRQPQVEKTVAANVHYRTPEGFVLLEPLETVSVSLRGNEDAIGTLAPFEVAVNVVFPDDAKAGTREILLGEADVSRPVGMEVVSLTPNRLQLALDEETEKLLTVSATRTGEAFAGARVVGIRVFPSQVLVRGPKTRLDTLSSLSTAQISIEGRARNFVHENVPILPPGDPLISLIGHRVVTVEIDMEVPEPVVESSAARGPSQEF